MPDRHLSLRFAAATVLALAGLGFFSGWAQAQTPAAPATPSPVPAPAPAPAPVAEAPTARSGTFKSVVGNVQVLAANGQTRPAQSGGGVTAQERVVTGADGSAAITLRDGTVIAIGPGSNVSINTFTFDPTTQNGSLIVSVLQGSIRMLTGLLAKVSPQSVQVQTPTSLVGVRGTDFIVEVPKL
jgi:hypothetical protein